MASSWAARHTQLSCGIGPAARSLPVGVTRLAHLVLERRLKDMRAAPHVPCRDLSRVPPSASSAMPGPPRRGCAHSQLKATLESPWNKAMPLPSSSALQRDPSSSAP